MQINLFQIAQDGISTLSALSEDAGWTILHPLSGQDRYSEYDIIRHYFTHQSVEEDALYGFLSQRFFEATHLTVTDVTDFISQHPGQDAYVFPVSLEASVCCWNIFEQGEKIYPGFKQIIQHLLDTWQIDMSADTVSMPLNRMVYHYDVIAQPQVWRQWMLLADSVVQLAAEDNALAAQLNTQVHEDSRTFPVYQLLIDCLLSLVLSKDLSLRSTHYDVHALPYSDKSFLPYMTYVASLDTLKKAYQISHQEKHMMHFLTLRKMIADRHLHKTLAQSHVVPYVCLTASSVNNMYPPLIKRLYMGDAQKDKEDGLLVRDLAPEWDKWYPALGNLVGMIAYKNYIIQHCPAVQKIGLCLPNKFIADAYSVSSDGYVNQPVLMTEQTLTAEKLKEMMLPKDVALLVSEPVTIANKLGKQSYLQYFSEHYAAEDLCRFLTAAVDAGVIESTAQKDFLSAKWFYSHGCHLGIFPADFWIQTVSEIEMLIRKCLHQATSPTDNHQHAVLALCADYLMGYMLHQYIIQHYPDAHESGICFGQCVSVSDIAVTSVIGL